MKTKISAFLDKVQQMRTAQNSYFKYSGDPGKRKQVLIWSKQLETEVDIEAQRLQAQLANMDQLCLTERARIIGELDFISARADQQSRAAIDQLVDELKAGHAVRKEQHYDH